MDGTTTQRYPAPRWTVEVDAVEGAAVMCDGISHAYKESANCRLEAQYAYINNLWCGFYGSVLANEEAFGGKRWVSCVGRAWRARASGRQFVAYCC